MIEVVKYGSKKRVTCLGCGSVLSYDENDDVKKKPCKKFGLNEMYTTYEKCIECPVCKNEIHLEPTVK